MSSQFIDFTAPSMQGGYPRSPESLPHGLISPPELVREMLAKEKAKYSPEVFNAEAEERILNQYTLDYYFDHLGHEVVYRQTPAGPEVVAQQAPIVPRRMASRVLVRRPRDVSAVGET